MGGRHRRPDDLDTAEGDAPFHVERSIVDCGCMCDPCDGGDHCHNFDTGCNS